jgi:hypothetical protein
MKKRITLTPKNGIEIYLQINEDRKSVELIVPDYGVSQSLNKKEVETLVFELQCIEDDLES